MMFSITDYLSSIIDGLYRNDMITDEQYDLLYEPIEELRHREENYI